MSSNFLVLNDSKTEIIHLTSRFATPREFPSIYVGETAVEPTSQVRDLDVVLDKHNKRLTAERACRHAFAAYWI